MVGSAKESHRRTVVAGGEEGGGGGGRRAGEEEGSAGTGVSGVLARTGRGWWRVV